MIKFIVFFTAFLTVFGASSLTAQPELVAKTTSPLVREGDFEFVKKLQPTATGLTVTLHGTVEECEEGLIKLFKEQADAKSKRLKKDVFIVEKAILNDISGNTLDYYYRLSPTDESNTQSQITFFLSHGNLNFLDSQTYPDEMAAAKLWLQRLDKRMESDRIQVVLEVEEKALEVGSEKEIELNKTTEKLAKDNEKLLAEQTKLKEDETKLNEKLEALNAKMLKVKEDLLRVEGEKTTLDAQILEAETARAAQVKITGEAREKVTILKQKQEQLKP